MQLPRLELSNTMALLGIQQELSTLSMRQPMADVTFNQPQPEVQYIKKKSHLSINQTEAFADANLKHPFRMVREAASKAKRELLRELAQESAEGDRLMKIENTRECIVPQIAKEEGTPKDKQFNIGYIPSSLSKVKVRYQPSEIDVIVHRGNFNIDIKPNYPKIRYHQGDVQVYLRQKASLHITAVGVNINQIF